MEIKTLNEQIERLRELIRKCYATVAGKNGTVPKVGERNMENLPNAIASTHDTLEELTITQNGEYLPQEGVDGFSKVVAEFDPSSLPKVKVTSFAVNNDCINDDGIWDGTMIDISFTTSLTFSNNHKVKSIDARGWDTSNMTSLSFMSCKNLEDILGIENFIVSKITNMRYLFQNTKIERLDLSRWDVRNVTNFQGTMYGMQSLVWLDISNWVLYPNVDLNSFFDYTRNFTTIVGDRTIDDIINNNIGVFIGLSKSTKPFEFEYSGVTLNRASLRALINGLADLTGQETQTLTLGAKLIAELTEEDIAIATSKNWTIA
jgi:surface protein